MQKFKDFIYYNRKEIIMVGIFTLLFALYPFFINKEKVNDQILVKENPIRELGQENNDLYIVDIKGEIINPGTYEGKENERVIDIIKKAGGVTDKADLSNINLSEKIYDEMLIRINSIDEKNNNELENKVTIQDEIIKDDKISINSATESELLQINGIGKTKANNIIKYRNKYGKFKKIEDIKNVSGIGDSTFEKIKDFIKI